MTVGEEELTKGQVSRWVIRMVIDRGLRELEGLGGLTICLGDRHLGECLAQIDGGSLGRFVIHGVVGRRSACCDGDRARGQDPDAEHSDE